MDIIFSDLKEELPIIEEDDSGFYEDIEAPNFVDFSAPDKYQIDDRSWFCHRFGCDQQHEEIELDPEALQRNFMLRVMAARSPNVKLQRSLNRHHQSPRSIKKCPHSAPAKSVKDRISRTNAITSIPNCSNVKLKTHPISSLRSTPSTKEVKTKTLCEKKALMTLRPKGLPTKHGQSVSAKIGNGKVESLKHKDAAKALFINSGTGNHDDICHGMKKLNMDSTKKNRKSMSLKKEIEAVLIHEEACKAISKVEVDHKFADDILSTISKESKQSENSEEFLKVNEAVHQVSKSDNSAEFDDDKENVCSTRCINTSTTNSESSENIQQKENKAPIKKIKELATHKGKVKRTTNPKPFRLRTDERGIVKEANLERKIQVKSQKENLTTLRHGDIKNRYAINEKNQGITLEGPKDNKPERVIVKEANIKSNIQLKTQKEILSSLRHGVDVKNLNVIHEKNHKATLEGPKAKSNQTRAPRVRYVESRYARSIPKSNKLQSETKETEVLQNKVIKTGSVQNTQRVSNLRKTVIPQAKVAERNNSMANATCLKGRKQLVANRETKLANPSARNKELLCKVDKSAKYHI